MPGVMGRSDELGLVLILLRHLKGWTQKELVAASGVSFGGLRGLEQGQRRQPTLKTLAPLATALGVDLAAIAEAAAVIHGLGGATPPGAAAATTSSAERADDLVITIEPDISQSVTAALLAAASVAPPGPGLPRSAAHQQPVAEASQDLGLAVKLLRLRRGMAAVDLAGLTGMAVATLQALENARLRTPPAKLSAVLSALGVDQATLATTLSLIRKLRRLVVATASWAEQPALPSQTLAEPTTLPDQLAALLLDEATAVAKQAACEDQARRRATTLWPLLARCPQTALRALVRQAPELQSVAACEMFCQQSLDVAGDSARRARQLAELAVMTAERARGSAGLRSRLTGFAGVHLANALRVAGNSVPTAGAAFDRALATWNAGEGADGGRLNAARVRGLEASMRRAQRRLTEALAAVKEGLRIDCWGETPALRLAKARVLIEMGEFAPSIDQLQQAAAAIDGDREPRMLYVVENLHILNLCHLGQFAIAAQRLPRLRLLAQSNRLDLLLAEWLAGKIAAGLGRVAEALALLLQVRADFLERHNAYDAALVTLEVAEIHASLGHTVDVKELARESAPIFVDQRVHREARRALALFRQAAEDEKATGELLHRLLVYLRSARQDPHLRFAVGV
jgi:transcriptional regulator with XRE-family HTH domain